MRAKSFLAILAVILASLGASRAFADPILDAVRAEAAVVSPLHHKVTRETLDNSGKTRQRKAVFDPRLPEGERWTLLERNHEPPSKKYQRKYEDDEDRDPPESYGRVLHYLDGPVTRLAQTETDVTYRIDRLGKGSIILHGEDISDKISGEAVVDLTSGVPFVREVRLMVAEAFKPMWLVRIESGEGLIRFKRTKDGYPVMHRQTLHVKGARPFGHIDYESDVLYQDYHPIAALQEVSVDLSAQYP
ncbi:hypothetical protein JCM17844_11580 [Iodidimonas gelatinilytica]|uniref:Outer membrane lipoprotein-sorting protein n=1 Tax=Iodidimonas gelatinilytica TaxID=1236966 RepID=A0A5A7N0N1_9PROT|nr:hypothetical protein [Iodidimonas gelatinilytica]GEQ97521.1 hypothetical protein JCM17844_11580 [Iodidimonas gelatinilytica]GER01577.1 hypothetical protein JCM17845_22000 [Iodidimonas gelatinilytica]